MNIRLLLFGSLALTALGCQDKVTYQHTATMPLTTTEVFVTRLEDVRAALRSADDVEVETRFGKDSVLLRARERSSIDRIERLVESLELLNAPISSGQLQKLGFIQLRIYERSKVDDAKVTKRMAVLKAKTEEEARRGVEPLFKNAGGSK